MSVKRCEYCNKHVEWLATTFKTRLPFEHELIDASELKGREGWVIVRKNGRALAAPLTNVGQRTASGARRALLVHTCQGYLDSKAAAGLSSAGRS